MEKEDRGEAPGVARVIALKLPSCKNTPSKRVPTRRGCLVSSRLGFFARDKTPRDISGRRDSRWSEMPLLIPESGIVIFRDYLIEQEENLYIQNLLKSKIRVIWLEIN